MNSIYSVNWNSILAIAIRDTMARYGRNNLGFLWSLIEPMLLATGVMILWSFIRAPYEHGVALMSMVFTGYLPLTLWRHISSVGSGLYLRSSHFLFHRSISLIDILLAKVLSEFTVTTAGALLIYFTLRSFDLLDPVYRWDLVIGGWLLMAWIATAFMFFFACLTVFYEDLDRFNATLQYILLPISGFFFLMEWLPLEARNIMWFNPQVHCYEMLRAGAIGLEITTYYDTYYPFLCGLALMIASLLMLRGVRERLHGQ